VSEELEELFEICDRLHVIAKGRLSPSIDRVRATVSLIGEWMSGLWNVIPVRAELVEAGPSPSTGSGRTGPGPVRTVSKDNHA
jgi:general nucleoside transport system ATP-binding protein